MWSAGKQALRACASSSWGRGSVQESVAPGAVTATATATLACEKQVDEVDVTGLGLMVWDRVGEQ